MGNCPAASPEGYAVGDSRFRKKSLSFFKVRLKNAGILMMSHSTGTTSPPYPNVQPGVEAGVTGPVGLHRRVRR